MPGPLRDPSPRALRRLAGGATAGGGTVPTDDADYAEWSLSDLRVRATELGLPGRSTMRKAELVAALRGR